MTEASGITLRRALLAIVTQCAWRNRPLPSRTCLGQVLGISDGSVSRYMNLLMDEGKFTVRYGGRRLYVVMPEPDYRTLPSVVSGHRTRNGMWKQHLKEP